MKRIALILLLIFLPTTSFAKEKEYNCALTFGIYTYHYTSGDYTEGVENRLIAVEWNGWSVASFNNSYGRETQFLGYAWHTRKFSAIGNDNLWVRGNIYAGALLGYGQEHPIHLGILSPGLYPTGSMGYDRYSLEVGLMPGFVWTGFKIEF